MTYPRTVPAVVGEADRQAHLCRWMAICPLGLYNADHSLHPGRLPEVGGDLGAPPPGDPAHVKTTYIRVNAVSGVQRRITQEECRAVFQSRPLVRNVLRRVLAEAYLREHPDSHEVMHSILEDWEQHA